MTAMAGNTVSFSHRLMLDFVLGHLGFNFSMAVKADLARLLLDEIGLIRTMRTVTDGAFTFCKRRMRRFFSLFAGQLIMAG